MNQQIGPSIKFENEQVQQSTQAHPWLSEHTQNIVNPIVRLHNQIIDFVAYVEPKQEQHENKLKLFDQIAHQLRSSLPIISQITNPFIKNKLYLSSTQLELFVIINDKQSNWQQKCIQAVSQISQKIGLKVYNLSTEINQHQCRVIVQHVVSATQVWIRFFSEGWSLFVNQIQKSVSSSYEIRYLYFIISCMVRQRNFHISIRSLLVYGLCGFFLYERRKQRVRTLTENIIKFLQFYSSNFGQQKQIKIVYREGNVYTYTSSEKKISFYISDKIDISHTKMKELLKVIYNRYRVLGNYYYPSGTSILCHLVNPCFGKFFY